MIVLQILLFLWFEELGFVFFHFTSTFVYCDLLWIKVLMLVKWNNDMFNLLKEEKKVEPNINIFSNYIRYHHIITSSSHYPSTVN